MMDTTAIVSILVDKNLLPVLAFLASSLTLIYLSQSRANKWAKFNVKGPKTVWPIVGSLYEAMFKDRIEVEKERRSKYGKIYGASMHGKDRLFIADAEVIRQIAIKDFDAFTNHQKNVFGNKYQQHFLVWLEDNHWKRVRSMMTPTFTSGKIRNMFRFLDGCSEDLVLYIRENLKAPGQDANGSSTTEGKILNLLDSFGMYTMDGISTCCYGLKLPRASILGDQDTHKKATRDDLLGAMRKCEGLPALRMACMVLLPKSLLRWAGFTMAPESNFRPFIMIVEKLIESRRQVAASGNEKKRYDDLLQLLVDARLGDKVVSTETDSYENHHAGLSENSLAEEQSKLMESLRGSGSATATTTMSYQLADHEILSEAAFMLLAGYETTRVLLTNCAYVLSHFEGIQERLHQEVRQIAHFNQETQSYQFNYDQLTSCAYLDAFISETLRFLPPAMHTDRVASRDYLIEKYNVRVPQNESLLFCIHSVHHDPDYWESPEEFNPDRFMPGQREKIIPGSYIPFSLGPRHCIGMRFSLTEAKLGLAKLLLHFKFSRAPGTIWPPKATPISALLKIKNPRAIVTAR